VSIPLILRPEAEQDLAEARDWYDGQREGLGGEFLERVEDTFEQIRERPELFALVYRRVRRCKVQRFPFVVYYRAGENRIDVLGVIHGSRHPRVWRTRL
jgi:plasmid stabilization system protein ParE